VRHPFHHAAAIALLLACASPTPSTTHVIVLTGVEGGKVFFNDPDRGVEKQNS
jgi:hypothetical protein